MREIGLRKDPYNLIIAGVGGQGNVLASKILAGMLVQEGLWVTVGESFGVSQRGGSVMSHLRISARSFFSPQIPGGKADLVVTLEPVEAIRVLGRYGNQEVKVLTNTRPIYPAGVIAGQLSYPALEEIKDALEDLAAKVWYIEATRAALELGSPILSNVIMMGATAGLGELPLSREGFRRNIEEVITRDKVDLNMKAFDLGFSCFKGEV